MVKTFQEHHWAVILGGSSGLGLASACKLAEQGMNLFIVHRDRRQDIPAFNQQMEQLHKPGIQVITHNTDALATEKRKFLINELAQHLGKKGRIRLLLHSIAKGNLKPMQATDGNTLSQDDFQITIQSMAISLYDWFKDLYDAHLFADKASVISFTSEGNKKAWKYYAAVSAAKATLEAITRNIALEYASNGIRANCIQAGVTETNSAQLIPGFDQIKAHSLARNPGGRLTTPTDVANVVYLLTRDEAFWINGTVIPVDGGEHIC